MRQALVPALAATLLVSAHGSAIALQADGPAAASVEAAPEEPEDLSLLPGRYRTTVVVKKISAKGMAMVGPQPNPAPKVYEACLSPQAAALGPPPLQDRPAGSDCQAERSASNGRFRSVQTCQTKDGGSTRTEISGTYSKQGYAFDMKVMVEMPQQMSVTVQQRIKSERIGDCSK